MRCAATTGGVKTPCSSSNKLSTQRHSNDADTTFVNIIIRLYYSWFFWHTSRGEDVETGRRIHVSGKVSIEESWFYYVFKSVNKNSSLIAKEFATRNWNTNN